MVFPQKFITEKLYIVNNINVLKKISEDKKMIINLCDNFDENLWTVKIMKYIIKNVIGKDMGLFIYFFDKFILNYIFRHDADHLIDFTLSITEFYSLSDNSENDYHECREYFKGRLKKISIDGFKLLIGMKNKQFFDNDLVEPEVASNLKQIYFNQIGYYIPPKLWKELFVINTAIDCKFFILQSFCINPVSYGIIKKCSYEERLMFFQQLKQHCNVIFPNQQEYFEYFDEHDDPVDKDVVNNVVEHLSNPELRKTAQGRQLEAKYELIPY